MSTGKKIIIYTIAFAVLFMAVFSLWASGALNNYPPFFSTTDGWNQYEREINNPNRGGNTSKLTEAEARTIAERSCIKGGEALAGGGTHNQNSKTWWFDANLNAAREGCHPACVVSEETKTAELNWRCPGLILPDESSPEAPQTSGQCKIENCHGLDIVCGPNPAEMCTMIYQLGDKCRQFAQCGVVDGVCQLIASRQFIVCQACAQQCEQDFPGDPDQAFACESACGE